MIQTLFPRTWGRLTLALLVGLGAVGSASADDVGVVRISDSKTKRVVRAQSPAEYAGDVQPAEYQPVRTFGYTATIDFDDDDSDCPELDDLECPDDDDMECPDSDCEDDCPDGGFGLCRRGFYGDCPDDNGWCPDWFPERPDWCPKWMSVSGLAPVCGRPPWAGYGPGRDGFFRWCATCPERCGDRFFDGICGRFGFCTPSGGHGAGVPLVGHYKIIYPVNPYYFDGRDGQVYAAQGYNGPVSVPLAPVVRHTYNYGWGVPSSRLTPISRPIP
jgi:hypothetical protein